MTYLPPLFLLAVVGQRGEKDVREGGRLLGVILGGGDTILIFCIWEKGERRRRERGGEGREEEKGGSSNLIAKVHVHRYTTLT